MKNFTVDNSLKNLGKVVLWQYDKAYRLLSLLKHMQVLFHVSVERFWAFWMDRVLAIDTCGEFGCALWSLLLGVQRPTIVDNAGNKRPLSAKVFRRLLKGHFFLLNAKPSAENISRYLEIVFGISGEHSISKWIESVSEYGWKTNVAELNTDTRPVQQYHVYRAYEKGRIFQFAPSPSEEVSNWIVTEDISARENVSWDAIRGKVEVTEKEADYSTGDDLIVLKLYDPNGFCRKMTGASSDSLSISISYVFGQTTITATVSRRRKSGVVVVDEGNMAMSYAKSEYFDLMLPDQKYLYEQYKDTILSYPLGIKTNNPVEEVIFGFEGQDNKNLYAPNTAYSKGDIFGYTNPTDETRFNWECIEDIGAGENVSFDAIKVKLRKTNKGDPFLGQLVDVVKPYGYVSPESLKSITYAEYGYLAITRENYPNLAAIFPKERFWRVGGDQLDSGCVFLEYDSLVCGRYRGTLYIYRIPSDHGYQYLSTEGFDITDGETYAARFSPSGLQVVTSRMPTLSEFAFLVKLSPDISKTPNIWGVPQIGNLYEKFGVTDAIGGIAHSLRWSPIAESIANNPIKGCRYSNKVGFVYADGLYSQDNKKIEPTAFISDTTNYRILKEQGRLIV